MPRPVRCLLVYPEFHKHTFWNFRAACELMGAKHSTAPLGLLTVAAMLPREWELRLVDCNVQPLADGDLTWADLVLTGGMLTQQRDTLTVIRRAKALGKTVVVGGPDATSSPHIYDGADYQVLGEAEVTLGPWLADYLAGTAQHRYEQGSQRADMSQSPRPRFDLIRFQNYLHLGVQFARGCPFLCEFCDIIELFGRVPRLKGVPQLFAELDELHRLGYRGHVDFVDDNFIGNKRDVKKLLPHLIEWQVAHNWPFEFSTEASINLADDEELLGLMQQAGFSIVFVGVESSDEDTLTQMQKRQNTRRSLVESIQKIHAHGMFVTTGYILGFDNESARAAEGILQLIEASGTAVNMVGLLFALPGTQLTRRLQREGRLAEHFDNVGDDPMGDQCLAGLNFVTQRPRADILRDYRGLLAEIYEPAAYFQRLARTARTLNCRGKKLVLPLKQHLRETYFGLRLIFAQGVRAPHRLHFWKMFVSVVWSNPRALRYTMLVAGLYQHFGPFSQYLLAELDRTLATLPAAENRELVATVS